jgi:bifunctional non-homologous end joining protein LigD
VASSSASRSTNWLKAKCYSIDEYELLGVEREAGKPAFALMAERGTGRYVGSAFVTLNRECASDYGNVSRSTQARRPKGMKQPAMHGSSRESLDA